MISNKENIYSRNQVGLNSSNSQTPMLNQYNAFYGGVLSTPCINNRTNNSYGYNSWIDDGFSTPKSVKKENRIKQLLDAPSVTHKFIEASTHESTPVKKKAKARDLTPQFSPFSDLHFHKLNSLKNCKTTETKTFTNLNTKFLSRLNNESFDSDIPTADNSLEKRGSSGFGGKQLKFNNLNEIKEAKEENKCCTPKQKKAFLDLLNKNTIEELHNDNDQIKQVIDSLFSPDLEQAKEKTDFAQKNPINTNASKNLSKKSYQFMSPIKQMNCIDTVVPPSAPEQMINWPRKDLQTIRNYFEKIGKALVEAFFYTYNSRNEALVSLFAENSIFEIINEPIHSFAMTMQCLSNHIKNFESDSSHISIDCVSEKEPFFLTITGKANILQNETASSNSYSCYFFTQSFKIQERTSFATEMTNINNMNSIISNYSIVHTKLLLSKLQ